MFCQDTYVNTWHNWQLGRITARKKQIATIHSFMTERNNYYILRYKHVLWSTFFVLRVRKHGKNAQEVYFPTTHNPHVQTNIFAPTTYTTYWEALMYFCVRASAT